MKALEEQLLEIKRGISQKETLFSKLQGQLESVMQRAKEKTDLDNLEDINKHLDQLGKALDKKEKDLGDDIAALKEEYERFTN